MFAFANYGTRKRGSSDGQLSVTHVFSTVAADRKFLF